MKMYIKIKSIIISDKLFIPTKHYKTITSRLFKGIYIHITKSQDQ